MKELIFILYVSDKVKSRDFYSLLLGIQPELDVPGMTEFRIDTNVRLGLMPERNIGRILGSEMPDPSLANGMPKCELYLYMDDPDAYYKRALELGAKPVSALEARNWGDYAAYCADMDGNVLAFACRISDISK